MLTLLFPIWGIAVPGTLLLFIVLVLKLPASIPLESALALIGILTLISLAGAGLTFFLEDSEIRLSKEGFSFPPRYSSTLRYRLQRSWDDLQEIRLNWLRQEKFADTDNILLLFKSGGAARLFMQKFAASDLEQFFIAFETCQNGCLRDAELDDFEFALQTRNKGELPSYTQIWEKSLSSRFSGATFVPLEPGSKVQNGKYHIMRQLGFGGFGAVYLARTPEGANLVLKESVFPQSSDKESKAEELFKREASILSKLKHPNIARVYDYFIEDGRHYLSMEYLDGIDLASLVSRHGPQSPVLVSKWAKNICSILNYLHMQEPAVIHRDISPENILLRPDGSVALIDFGAAKEIAASFTGTIIGKQSYISPEQFRGKAGPKSDIYALGATMHFLLTGKQPKALTKSSPSSLGEYPQELDRLIQSCTEQDESLRPSAEDLLKELSSIKAADMKEEKA